MRHFNPVLDALDVSVVLCSCPGKDWVKIAFEALRALADDPRVLAIRESSGSLLRATGIATRSKGRFQLVSGPDGIALDFILWATDAGICGTANRRATTVCDLDRTFSAGDLAGAKAIMAQVWPATNILVTGTSVQKLKSGCALQGTSVGPCPIPLGPLTAEATAAFAAAMAPVVTSA